MACALFYSTWKYCSMNSLLCMAKLGDLECSMSDNLLAVIEVVGNIYCSLVVVQVEGTFYILLW